MTKKTWESKPPRYQDEDPDQPPPYTHTPEETTPLLSANSSYPSSCYATSSSSQPLSTPSSTYAPSTSGSSSLPSDFPKRNRAGPAGVSAAHTLSTSFKSKDINLEIVLFEQKSQIGGRIVLNPSFPKEHLGRKIHAEDLAAGEVGGNILRERARNFLGIEFGQKGEARGKEVGFFDGESLVAKLTRPLSGMSWGGWLGLVWKYKFSFLNAKELPKGTMKSFERFLASRETFESVSHMVKAAGIEGPVGLSAAARLAVNGVGGEYVDEVISPQVLRQTGQDATELSDLAISMALEKEDQVSGGDIGSFEGVLEKFIERSGAALRLDTKVTGLKRELVDEGKEAWVLELKKPGHHALEYEVFDHVVLTGPSSLLPKHKHHEDEVYYRSLWVTFLLSTKELNKEYFGSSEEMPPQVLPIQSKKIPSELEGVHEISYVGDVFGPDVNTEAVRKLYRIFSDRSLSKENILAFGEAGVLEMWEENIGNAYPLMWPRNGKFGDFKGEEGLWRTGVIEAIGSSVDLSWVAGENVARRLNKPNQPPSKPKAQLQPNCHDTTSQRCVEPSSPLSSTSSPAPPELLSAVEAAVCVAIYHQQYVDLFGDVAKRRFWSIPSGESSGRVLRVTPRFQAGGGNQQIQENDGLVGGRASLKAVLEKVRFQYLMGAYNSEELFCVAPHHIQANWLGIFDEVMNTTQDAQYLWSRGVENSKAQRPKQAQPKVAAIKMKPKIVLRKTAAGELAI
ncbi:hypothetical protein BGZ57DRAFT_955389 [Hyaloscypha finlandica]|nr:hypothetical protein BGZ57DRAFT_955389 [Hyaloscypha finlandica]